MASGRSERLRAGVLDGDQERDAVFAERVRRADVLVGDPVDDLPTFVRQTPT